MKRFTALYIFLMLAISLQAQNLIPGSLTCEHKLNPVGIGTSTPRLSWIIQSTGRNVMQSAYSVQVATDDRFPGRNLVWQSGKVESGESVLVQYAGNPLESGTRYYWRVKIWDNKGKETRWSQTASFETGLLTPDDWKAKWIEIDKDTIRYSPAPHFRKEFIIDRQIAKARIYVTSHGYYELHLNGRKVGDQVLTPGWTSYNKRLQYQVYDVTAHLNRGGNALGAVLGDGWYRGTTRQLYGKRLGLLLQLKISYTDGTEQLIVTDESWKGNMDGAIRMNDNYNGEIYDARKKLSGWDLAGYDDADWIDVRTGQYPLDNIIASEGMPVRKIQEIKPVNIFRTPKGSLVVDMGQNMVGWIRLKVTGPKGTEVVLRHAEIMDKYGEFYTENLRRAKCQINYTLAGTGEEVYEPRFTFMGFRYVEVSGFPGELKPENITGVAVHSDMTPAGTFESSNPLVNKLQHNILWGMKGNFVDVPTDCPQRDERLGWTGDAQVFCRTAAFNMDVASFFTKWMKDIAADQRQGGEVPDVIPDVLNRMDASSIAPSAGWGDVAVIAPWTMYLVYGDKKILETQYPSMKAWVEYIRKKAGNSYIWHGGSKYGDWLFYHPPVNNHTEADGHTERDFIATAYFAYSTRLLALAAGELDKTDDQKYYQDLFEKIKKVFIHEYITPAGRIGTNSQTSYVLALFFDLVPEEFRPNAAGFLVDDIKSRNNHLSTGFLGTPYLCHVLTSEGYTDVAYDLLLQETYPSWLYPVKMGATTIWERWDGQKTDSTFQDSGMNSFNHYAYGAIGDWMYRVSAGIEIASPGYRNILIQPHPVGRLDFARATFDSPYGRIASGWERIGDKITARIVIPANTKATVVLPADSPDRISEAGKPVRDNADFNILSSGHGQVSISAGSGDYTFEISR